MYEIENKVSSLTMKLPGPKPVAIFSATGARVVIFCYEKREPLSSKNIVYQN